MAPTRHKNILDKICSIIAEQKYAIHGFWSNYQLAGVNQKPKLLQQPVITKFCIIISQEVSKEIQANYKNWGQTTSHDSFSFAIWFVSYIERVSRPITDRNKETKAVGDYFLHSVKNYSISKFQSNHENSIAIQELKLIQTKKPATSKNVMFYLNLSFQLKIKFRERSSKISQFFLVAFCFFVELFLFCSQSCRNTFF